MRTRISVKEVLGFVCRTELGEPILPREDPRWEALKPWVDPEVNLRDG